MSEGVTEWGEEAVIAVKAMGEASSFFVYSLFMYLLLTDFK